MTRELVHALAHPSREQLMEAMRVSIITTLWVAVSLEVTSLLMGGS